MSEPVARQRPMIDLDEFERRLRRPAASPPLRNEDPLAELARLVGDEKDPYRGMFQEELFQESHEERPVAQAQAFGSGRLAGAARLHEQPRVSPSASLRLPPHVLPRVAEPVDSWAARPSAPAPENGSPASRNDSRNSAQNLRGNFAAIEAGLRGSIQPEFRNASQNYEPEFQQHYDQRWNEDLAPEEDDADWLDQAQTAAPRRASQQQEPPRSRRLLYMTAAIILVGITGIGATFAIKRSPVSPQQIAMIKAATSPAKIQAAVSPASDGAKIIQDASVLDKAPQPLPVGVVNRAEQPVDLGQAEARSANGAAPQSAASVPVPQPPAEDNGPNGRASAAPDWQGRTAGTQVADAAPAQAFGLGGMIQPKKVKTVTVRPDGTIAADDAPTNPPSATTSGAAQAMPGRASNAQDATPKTAARATASGARAAERATLVADRGGSDAVTPVKPKTAARATPLKLASIAKTSTDTAVASSHAGDFAVQLAAPATEADARHAITQLEHQYAGQLGGRPLKWHHAKVGSKSVYRVRVGSLSKPAAVTLCQAIEAKGGKCFVARD